MPAFLHRYATPLITGLFLVSLISGLALFFHVGPGGFHAMHEWLSLVLIVPFVLHLWRNWRPMICYFKHAPMVVALALSLIGAVAFVLPGQSQNRAGGPPQFTLASRLLQASPADLAPALHVAPRQLADALRAAGFDVADDKLPLEAIATASGKSPVEAMLVLNQVTAP